MYNKFQYSRFDRYDPLHLGHDFTAYFDNSGVEHFGLDPQTPVRSISSGYVHGLIVPDSRFAAYERYLVVKYPGIGLVAGYGHIEPTIEVGKQVAAGDILGRLYFDESGMFATHLHFELGMWRNNGRDGYPYLAGLYDPLLVLPGLIDISVDSVSSLPPQHR